jgi:hypothetical protein
VRFRDIGKRNVNGAAQNGIEVLYRAGRKRSVSKGHHGFRTNRRKATAYYQLAGRKFVVRNLADESNGLRLFLLVDGTRYYDEKICLIWLADETESVDLQVPSHTICFEIALLAARAVNKR